MLKQMLKDDIYERQEALSKIKTLYLRYKFKQDDEQIFLNYAIPSIYAIWEGFVQTSFQTYIHELNKLQLKHNEICDNLLVKHIESTFKQFNEYPKDFKKKVTFFQGLEQFYQAKYVDINKTVNTESNVGFDVINKLLISFNLKTIPEYPEPGYSLKKALIDFLDMRNKLAHGQNAVKVSRSILNESTSLVIMLMNMVYDLIIDGYENKSYLAK
jgi:hypothetical protein